MVSGLLVWVHSVHYYMVFNRLLIPTGLHHALNNVFWFDTAGINDIGKFQSGKNAIKGNYWQIPSRIFPCYDVWCTGSSFGDVSYCKDESKTSLCLVLASSVSAFFVGVTEPIEFAFMFVAPVLFVIHAVLTGLSLFIAAMFHWTAGFSFSAGLIDYVLSLVNPISNQPWMLLLQGVVFLLSITLSLELSYKSLI